MKIAVYGDNKPLLDILRAKGVELSIFGVDFLSWKEFPKDARLLLTLGGDGTFLKSLSLVRDSGVPIAGINFGRLGFLTAAKAGEGENGWIDRLVEGDYTVEERQLLKVESDALPDGFYPYAGNECSIQRQGASMLAIDVRLDGRPIPTYWADGIVTATPTGSTAYSLSVGGPIVMPGSEVFILAPIAPHNLNMRPIVIPQDSAIDMVFTAREGNAVLTVDNRSVVLPSGSNIRILKGDYGFRYVSLSDNTFINALRTKLLWGEDRRNR